MAESWVLRYAHRQVLSIGWGVETRSGYTDAIVASLLDNASGTGPKSAQATGALEACAGLVGRSLSRCAVTGDDHGLVGPWLLAAKLDASWSGPGAAVYVLQIRAGWTCKPDTCLLMGRDWRRGPGDVALPRGPGIVPARPFTRTASYAEVLHFKWATDPARPWAGVAPMGAASGLAKLIGALEGGLGDDAGSPRGQVLSVAEGVAPDGDGLAELRGTIAKLRGKVALIETTRHGSGAGHGRRDQEGFRGVSAWWPIDPSRGAAMAGSPRLRRRLPAGFHRLCSAKGGDGTGERESFRRWVATGLQPLADAVAV